jgi:pimeloyl-ACP methyl ester carboxylesterase
MAGDGVELAVQIEGSGPPVLLLHGFPDDRAVWRHQIPALVAAGYTVIAPDQRGCGESQAPTEVAAYRIERLVADLVALLDGLGIERARIVGHDWGAVLGWQLAIRHPERVEHYVALSVGHPNAYATAGLAQKLKGWYTLLFLWRGGAEAILSARNWAFFRAFTALPTEAPLWIARLSAPGRLTAAINWYRANLATLLFDRFPPAGVPVTGVWSRGDRYLTEGQMTASAAHATGGWRYHRLDGCGHWMTLEAPDAVNALLIAAFANPPAPDRS